MHLQHQESLLLPKISTFFLDCYCGAGEWSTDVPVVLENSDSTVNFTHKWLLHLLIIHLQSYMKYKCVVRKIGTVIYPRDSDLLVCLSWALHQHSRQDYQYKVVQPPVQNQASTISQAGACINERLLGEIKTLSVSQHQPKELDIEWCISKCDPLIWDFLTRVTQSARELSGSEQSPTYKKSTQILHLLLIDVLHSTEL